MYLFKFKRPSLVVEENHFGDKGKGNLERIFVQLCTDQNMADSSFFIQVKEWLLCLGCAALQPLLI